MTDRELMKMALDALESATPKYTRERKDGMAMGGALDYWRLEQHIRMPAIQALRARLAQHSEMDEAIAAGDGTLHGAIDYWQKKAQREWVGLTDEEVLQTLDLVAYDTQAFDFAYRIEQALKEKNG